MRKTILVILISIGILALGVGIFFAWEKSKININPFSSNTDQPVQNNNLPLPQNKQKLSILSKDPIIFYWTTNSTSSEIFYINQEGKISIINGNDEKLVSDVVIKNIQSVKNSLDGKLILVKSKDRGDFRVDIFDAGKNIWLAPLIGATAADFSPDSKKIAYLKKNSKNESDLIIKDLTDSKQKETKIFSLNQIGFDMNWLDNDRIIFVSKPAFDVLSEVWEFNIKTKAFSKIMEGNGLMLNWAKFGDAGLKFVAKANRSYDFQLINRKGTTIGNFSFKTFPDKCFISSPEQIYCAIPRNQDIFNSGIYPDDYLKRNIFFTDGIYQVDMNRSSFKAMFEENDPVIDVVQLTLFGNKLLFINRYDNKLYQLEL